MSKLKLYAVLVLLTIVTGLLGAQTWRLDTARRAEAKAVKELGDERTAAALKYIRTQGDYRSTENTLQAGAAATRERINEATAPLLAQRDALLKRVRVAEANLATAKLVSSTTTVAGSGRAATGSDGPELLGTLGEADVLEAERGETIRLHLAACYSRYEQARTALSKFKHSP